jgi:hypothetical protein
MNHNSDGTTHDHQLIREKNKQNVLVWKILGDLKNIQSYAELDIKDNLDAFETRERWLLRIESVIEMIENEYGKGNY